jgi:hypothetical protein
LRVITSHAKQIDKVGKMCASEKEKERKKERKRERKRERKSVYEKEKEREYVCHCRLTVALQTFFV